MRAPNETSAGNRMSAAAFVYGIWGGLLGFCDVLTQHFALAFLAIPIASFLGGALAKASPKMSALLMGVSTAAWLLLVHRHRFDLLTATTMLLSGFGALFSVNDPTMRYPNAKASNEEAADRGR
jgi:hypothetical protein